MKKHVMICVCGGIAAYKVCDLVSKLTQKDYDVRVIMTEKAEHFVAPLTFETLSHHPVYLDGMDYTDGITHIELAQWADVALVAPATANTIAKLVHGIADNLVTTTLLACTCPVLICPAMNSDMLNNPITQKNIQLAISYGFQVLEPDEGLLACGVSGRGRLPSTKELIDFIEKGLVRKQTPSLDPASLKRIQLEPLEENDSKRILEYARVMERARPLAGYKILVSAGPTAEAIDPIRYITNHSSGKQGYAIAEAARSWGADVTLVSGPTALPVPEGVHYVEVRSALQMEKAMLELAEDARFIIMAAAVADYRPKEVSLSKIKKGTDSLVIELVANPDILMELCANRKTGQIICGFAMETENLIQRAKEKLERKGIDLIVANNLTVEGAGFKEDTNVVTILQKSGVSETLPILSKKAIAYRILARMLELEGETDAADN